GCMGVELFWPDGSRVGYRAFEVNAGQVRPGELRAAKVGLLKVRSLQLGSREVSAGEVSAAQIHAFKPGMPQQCGPQISLMEVSAKQHCCQQPDPGQIRPA